MTRRLGALDALGGAPPGVTVEVCGASGKPRPTEAAPYRSRALRKTLF
ncbi:MAG: hypothetical protein FWG88_01290 [Oscillospiraceae bacterium]|nr:hypothetical protein [Oscillospiraceae bacterium]